jgi:hypothetical protein
MRKVLVFGGGFVHHRGGGFAPVPTVNGDFFRLFGFESVARVFFRCYTCDFCMF